MKPRHPFIVLVVLFVVATAPLSAQWRVEAWLGDAWNAHSRLTIRQQGQPDLSIRPDWSTEPWEPTWYYAGRISRWSSNHGWALEYIHHKVYLENPPAEVEYFRITNGLNFWVGERLWRAGSWEVGVGGGPVWVVPISKVRGQVYDKANGVFGSQYELGGAALTADLTRRVKLLPWVHGLLSIKGTAATVRANVGNGKASMVNYALHLNYGLSLQDRRDSHPR